MLIDIPGIGLVRLNWYYNQVRTCLCIGLHTILGKPYFHANADVSMIVLDCHARCSGGTSGTIEEGLCLGGRKLIES